MPSQLVVPFWLMLDTLKGDANVSNIFLRNNSDDLQVFRVSPFQASMVICKSIVKNF